MWKAYLAERNIPYNSIQAGWAIFQFYYEKNNQDKLKAILEFKGVKQNTKVKEISKKIIKITNNIKRTLNDTTKQLMATSHKGLN